MPKFRKRPVIIEAERFWLRGNKPEGVYMNPQTLEWYINTLEGPLHVSDGDWIITGVKGEKYPCKDDIFHQTYERVEPIIEEKF